MITMGQSPDSATVNGAGGGLPFLQGCAEFGARFPQPRFHCSPPLRVAKSGSILISVRAPVGTTNRADQDYCIGRGLGAVLAKPGIADDVFLLHAIEANLEFLHRRSQGSTFLAIGSKELSSLPVPAPEFAVQRRIAEILSTLDEAIAQTEALIAKHQQIKAGLMHDLFTRGLTSDGRLRPAREQAPDLYKESPLRWIPKEWEVVRIDNPEIAIIDGDRGVHYPQAHELLESGHCLFLSATNVTKDGFKFDTTQFISREKDELLGTGKLARGDIVITTRGTVGNIAHFDNSVAFSDVRINSGMVIIRSTHRGLDTEFLYCSLRNYVFLREYQRVVSGSAQPQLPIRDMKRFHCLMPPLPEQQLIVGRVALIGNRLGREEEFLAKLRQQKHGLMHDLLTGRVRITVNEAEAASGAIEQEITL